MITFSPQTKIKSADVNQNFTDLSTGAGDVPNNSLLSFRKESVSNHVVSGLIFGTSANLTSAVTAGVAVVNGTRIAVSAFSHAFTASKDTYVDLKDDGTLSYVEVVNGAILGMTMTLNSDGSRALRIAKVVTSGTAVTAVYQAGVFTSASSWFGFDPLGSSVYNTNPDQNLFGYNQKVTNSSSTAESIQLQTSAYIPANTPIKVTVWSPRIYNDVNANWAYSTLYEGVFGAGGTQVSYTQTYHPNATASIPLNIQVHRSPAAGYITYSVTLSSVAGTTGWIIGYTGGPFFIRIERA